MKVLELGSDEALINDLLCLLAAADEASAGVGLPLKVMLKTGSLGEDETLIVSRSAALLNRGNRPTTSGVLYGASLCDDAVDPMSVRVLPKCHTPQAGITLRSLSHNLALCTVDEVVPIWLSFGGSFGRSTTKGRRMANILVIPWPESIERYQFLGVGDEGPLRNMDERFGFFHFSQESNSSLRCHRVEEIFHAALKEAQAIDMVVLPELALDIAEYEAVSAWARETGVILIAGVGESQRDDDGRLLPSRNYVAFEMANLARAAGSESTVAAVRQHKHHRWQLDRGQIERYGLGGHLDPERRWWEYLDIQERRLHFVSLLPSLTVCALVCEDLAQQEPVARLVRAVGPNLIISVLMDGPQLATRWSARYAGVLAEDPGSSILTVTSLGMCQRSLPPGMPLRRTVALWNDTRHSAMREIEMEEGASAVVLNVLIELGPEWSADGRSDDGHAGFPTLAGAYSIFTATTSK